MDDWVLALIGVSLLACICICGELATWVKEDDDKTKGFKKTTSKKTYMGAPMRMTFSGFDLPEKKRRARKRGPEKKRRKRERQEETVYYFRDVPRGKQQISVVN
jgi:hypothetical protein